MQIHCGQRDRAWGLRHWAARQDEWSYTQIVISQDQRANATMVVAERAVCTDLGNDKMRSAQMLENMRLNPPLLCSEESGGPFCQWCLKANIFWGSSLQISGKPWCLPPQRMFPLSGTGTRCPLMFWFFKLGPVYFGGKTLFSPLLLFLTALRQHFLFAAPPVSPKCGSSCPVLPCHNKVVALYWVPNCRTVRCPRKLHKELTVFSSGKRWCFSCSCSRSTSGLVGD